MKYLSLSLLLVLNIAPIVTVYGSNNPTELFSENNNQAKLDIFLQALGQGINSGGIKVADKDLARSFVSDMRAYVSSKNLHETEIVSALCYVEASLKSGFSKEFDSSEINTNLTKSFNLEDISKVIDSKISSLSKKAYGLGAILRPMILSAEKLDKATNFSKVVKRLTPYAALGLYYTTIMKKEHLPQWRWLQAIKDLIGGTPQLITKTEEVKSKGLSVEDGARIANDFVEGNDNDALGEVEDARIQASTYESQTDLHGNVTAKEKSIAFPCNPKTTTIKKDTAILVPGLFGTPISYLGKLIKFETSPEIKFAPMALILPYLKKDFADLSKFITEQKDKVYAFAKGEKHKPKNKFKKSSDEFKKIIGYESTKAKFMPLINYFKNKDLFKLAGVSPERGYLLLGASETASTLVQGLAGEIENAKIKEIHASDLIKGFKPLMEDADEDDVNIVFIKDIDWLTTAKIKSSDWQDIISGLDSNLSGSKQTYIIASTSSLDKVNPIITESTRLGNIIKIEELSKKNIISFITKELKNISENPENFEIDSLADLFLNNPKSSYKSIKATITKAFVNAQAMNEKFTQDHIQVLIS